MNIDRHSGMFRLMQLGAIVLLSGAFALRARSQDPQQQPTEQQPADQQTPRPVLNPLRGQSSAETDPKSAGCVSCHKQNAATDNVFTQFYPVLRAVKPK